jgi:hypothetical protein
MGIPAYVFLSQVTSIQAGYLITNKEELHMMYYRKRRNGYDDCIIEIQKRKLKTLFLYRHEVGVSTTKAVVNSLDKKIIEKIGELKKLLSDRKTFAEQAQAEYDEFSKLKTDWQGNTAWFPIDEKAFKAMCKAPCEEQNPSWRDFLHPLIIREYGLNVKAKSEGNGMKRAGDYQTSGHVAGRAGETVAIMQKEHSKYAVHLNNDNPGLNAVVLDRGDEDKKGNNSNQSNEKKAQMRKIRQQHPFNDREWENNAQWERYIAELWEQEYGK